MFHRILLAANSFLSNQTATCFGHANSSVFRSPEFHAVRKGVDPFWSDVLRQSFSGSQRATQDPTDEAASSTEKTKVCRTLCSKHTQHES